MDYSRLLEFQINGLGYNFKNVDLLQEALTHSLDPQDGNPQFPNQNRGFQRLQIIGNAVLKFTISEFVIQTSDVTAGEGVLTAKKEALIKGTIQKSVGERLFHPFTTPQGNLFNYVRTCNGFKMEYFRTQGIPFYEKLVRSLIGAVYVDAGGISGDGLQAASNLFFKLWKDNLEGMTSNKSLESIQSSFPPPNERVLAFWREKGVSYNFYKTVERSIGVNFQNQHLLGEALVQKSFYQGNSVQQEQRLPEYQRLEFLGDSVLDLIVTELLWLEYPHDTPTALPLDHKISALISDRAQKEIFQRLGLHQLVKMNLGVMSGGWTMHGDIVESIVGAVYVDGGVVTAKEFIIKTWDLQVYTREPNLEDLQEKLGYKFRNIQFLIRALSHPGVVLTASRPSEESTELNKKLREALVYFGKSWIQFHATEYVLRSCSEQDSLAGLVNSRNLLCGEPVLLRIASYLNLSKYVALSREQQNRGLEPYMIYEGIIHAMAGAIFKDMQEVQIKMSFSQVFFRLWNPFLNQCPRKLLQDSVPSSGPRCALRDWQVTEIEGNLRHTFTNQYLLEYAISTNQLGGMRNNKDKFSFVGESALDLAVSVYVTILCYMNLQNPEIRPSQVDIEGLHAQTLVQCIDLAERLYEPEVVMEHAGSRPGACGIMADEVGISEEQLIKRLFGAIYVDLTAEHNADMSFSKWKQYFFIRCEFISGR